MDSMIFYIYDLRPTIKDMVPEVFQDLLENLWKEVSNDGGEKTISETEVEGVKLGIQLLEKVDQGKEKIYFGKFICSESPKEYRKEIRRKLYNFEEDLEGICHLSRGTLYFLLYSDSSSATYKIILEYLPFKLQIGGLKAFFLKKYKDKIERMVTTRVLGEGLLKYLDSIKTKKLKVAKIRLIKKFEIPYLKKIGLIDNILKSALQKNMDLELIIRPKKESGITLKNFIKKLSRGKEIKDLAQTNFVDLFMTLNFKVEGVEDKLDIKKRILKFIPSQNKKFYLDNENKLFLEIFAYFKENKAKL